MPAGPMRHRVEIQSVTEVLDTHGEAIETWITDAIVWGRVEPLSGAERFQAKTISPETSHRILIRYRPGVTSKHRLVHRDRVLGIESVLNLDERNETLEILAREES